MITWRIVDVAQPINQNTVTGGYESADYLRVTVESDTDQRATLVLAFDDHAGLEAEWNAGSVTTVLDAAVDAKITTDVHTADDELPSGTGTGKDDYQFTQ